MDQADRHRVEEVELFPASAPGDHESGLFQHPEVLHDAEAGQGETPNERAEGLAIALEERVQELRLVGSARALKTTSASMAANM